MRAVVLFSVLMAAVAFAKKPVVAVAGDKKAVKLLGKELRSRFIVKEVKASGTLAPGKVPDVTRPVGAVALVLAVKAGKNIDLVVRNAADGATLDTVTLAGAVKKPPKALTKSQLASLTFALNSGQPAGKSAPPTEEKPPPEEKPKPEPEPKTKPEPKSKPPPEPEPVEEVDVPEQLDLSAAREPVEEPEEEPEESPRSKHFAFRASVGGGFFNRSITWLDSQSEALTDAPHPASGAVSVELNVFPGAGLTSNFLAHLGVFFTSDLGVNLRSRYAGTDSVFVHESWRLRMGAQARLPIVDSFHFFFHAGYARHTLTTSATSLDGVYYRPPTPDLLYNGFRGGAGLRWTIFGPLELEAFGGIQYLASMGELKEPAFFPDATGFAVDAGGALSVEVIENLRLRVSVEWQRYFVTLNAGGDTPYFARAAGDQYVWAQAGLQWSM